MKMTLGFVRRLMKVIVGIIATLTGGFSSARFSVHAQSLTRPPSGGDVFPLMGRSVLLMKDDVQSGDFGDCGCSGDFGGAPVGFAPGAGDSGEFGDSGDCGDSGSPIYYPPLPPDPTPDPPAPTPDPPTPPPTPDPPTPTPTPDPPPGDTGDCIYCGDCVPPVGDWGGDSGGGDAGYYG